MSRTQISGSLESLHRESDPVVTVQHLVKRYGQFVAVNDASAPQSGGSIEALRLFLSEPSRPGWHARDPWDQPRQEFHIQEIVWWSEAETVDSARLGGKPQDCHSG